MNKEDIIQTKVEELRTFLSMSEELLLNELNDYIKQLQQENKQLKDNWNKLKEWLNEDIQRSIDLHFQVLRKSDILDKMQELEKSDNDVEYK